MKIIRWSAVELEALEDLAGNVPSDRLPEDFRQWAMQHGYPPRTTYAIRTMLNRMGLTSKSIGDWVSIGVVCDLLGVGRDTPTRWVERQWVDSYRNSRNWRYFCRSDLRRMARERPAVFGGIAPERLYLLLEDRQLSESIAQRFTRRAMQPRPICALETGWRYPSIRAAAARVYCSRQAIQYAIRSGGTAAGYHWNYV